MTPTSERWDFSSKSTFLTSTCLFQRISKELLALKVIMIDQCAAFALFENLSLTKVFNVFNFVLDRYDVAPSYYTKMFSVYLAVHLVEHLSVTRWFC